MRIAIRAYELRPGDVYRGRRIVGVKPPRIEGGMMSVDYETGNLEIGHGGVFMPLDELEVERNVERIMQ